MKLIRNILLSCLIVLFSGCSDFLDKSPLEDPSTSNVNTASDAIAIINGAYQPLQWPKLYNFRIWTLDIVAGNSIVGAGGGTDGGETVDLSNFVTATNNAAALDIWRGPAPGILRCNLAIKTIPGMDIDQSIKDRCIGEAKFLRANYYFILVRLFGDVPLLTEPQNPTDDLQPVRTSKDKIYELIVQDLKDAVELLPTRETYTGTDIGRASKGSACGLLAKVYLTLGDNVQAEYWCKQVTTLGYTLNADYSDNFSATNKNTQESLFEVQYYGLTNVDFQKDNDNQASWLSTFMGPRNSSFVAGSYGWNQPTEEFVQSYEAGDLRKDKTILYEGCPAFDGKDYKASYSNTGYNVRKFLVPTSISSDFNTNKANVTVLRYADVLLMEAEALNEQGKTVEAETPLYEVRKRAGLTDRSSIEGLTQDQMRDKIIHERRIELAFEGHRWFDMIRIKNGQYALDFLHSIGKVNATSKNLLLPIPQKEIDANPNLVQNTGY